MKQSSLLIFSGLFSLSVACSSTHDSGNEELESPISEENGKLGEAEKESFSEKPTDAQSAKPKETDPASDISGAAEPKISKTSADSGSADTSNEDAIPENKAPETEGSTGARFYVKASKLNVRSQPSLDGAVLKTLSQGEEVQVQSVEGDWAKIAEGEFVSNKYLGESQK